MFTSFISFTQLFHFNVFFFTPIHKLLWTSKIMLEKLSANRIVISSENSITV